jgi:hypothetical protein
MNKDKREGWLKELKVGDEIAISYDKYGRSNYRIEKVEKISPTGRITSDSTVYDSDGREMGKHGSWDVPERLVPVTQEIRNGIRKRVLIAKLNNINLETIELEKLESIVKILEGTE